MENGVDLEAKITADVVHNGERGFRIHIIWLYSSSISQSYRGFTDFGGISSGIPRLNTARWWLALQGGLDSNKISGVGKIFGLLVHVLPGMNKQRAPKSSMVLS